MKVVDAEAGPPQDHVIS